MHNFYDYSFEKLQKLMEEYGQKKFRAQQLYTWVYEKKVRDFSLMSDISAKFIEVLKSDFSLSLPKIAVKQVAHDGTIKLLLELEDGAKVETVLMRYEYGNAVCVSSQVGCNMGCSFCASGLLKKQRNLTPSEMVGQVLVIQDQLEEGARVSHVVVMGTGEPFDNYDNVMDFIRIINHPHSLAIGARHITVSTCGLVDKIRQYADENLQINLAISLHAPNDEIRNKIMLINKAYPLEVLMDAIRYYESKTSRRVTFEYIMLKGVNDSDLCAKQLASLLKGINSYVNLIPYNAVDEHLYKRSNRQDIENFANKLKKLGVNATIRKEFGTDIDAACGQLRAKNMKVLNKGD